MISHLAHVSQCGLPRAYQQLQAGSSHWPFIQWKTAGFIPLDKTSLMAHNDNISCCCCCLWLAAAVLQKTDGNQSLSTLWKYWYSAVGLQLHACLSRRGVNRVNYRLWTADNELISINNINNCSIELKWDGKITKMWYDNEMRWIRIMVWNGGDL